MFFVLFLFFFFFFQAEDGIRDLVRSRGLGKTMQTIVTMRLLFQQGHVRRAVLVCPKPLVTNWQREFALWAPELPLTIIEGKQGRREWLRENAREGVLIANYE